MKLWKYLKNKMQLNLQQEICENDVSMTFEEMIVFTEQFSKKLTTHCFYLLTTAYFLLKSAIQCG